MSNTSSGWMDSVFPYDNGPERDERDLENLRLLHEQRLRYEAERPEREAKEQAERERIATIKAARLAECQDALRLACECPVKVGAETFQCPVLRTINGSGRARSWAIMGAQCFPVVLNLGIHAFCLDEPGCAVPLQGVIEGHASRGYSFERW